MPRLDVHVERNLVFAIETVKCIAVIFIIFKVGHPLKIHFVTPSEGIDNVTQDGVTVTVKILQCLSFHDSDVRAYHILFGQSSWSLLGQAVVVRSEVAFTHELMEGFRSRLINLYVGRGNRRFVF